MKHAFDLNLTEEQFNTASKWLSEDSDTLSSICTGCVQNGMHVGERLGYIGIGLGIACVGVILTVADHVSSILQRRKGS